MNLPTLAFGTVGVLPPLVTLDTNEVLTFVNNTAYGATYVKHSDVGAITNPKETWFKRLEYLVKTIPTRYKVAHTAANQTIRTAITVTNKALIGNISLRGILCAWVDDYDGTNYFIHPLFNGVYSGATGTFDYVYHTYKPLFPLRPITGHTWYMHSVSAAYFSADLCNLYFEVYNNLPTPPW